MRREVRPSPWWYRQRGSVIGLIYGVGFFAGNAVRFGAGPPRPVVDVLGSRLAGGHGVTILLWAACASALVAWLLRASGTAYLRRDVVFAADVQRDRLIVAGVFRHVRNPLYLGNVFLALAVAVLAPPLGCAIIVLGNVAIVAMLAAEEARMLASDYGARYEAFRRAVPAFVPRFTPATVPGSVAVPPDWRAGLVGEAFCLALAVAFVPLAVFGQAGLTSFYVIGVTGMVVWTYLGWRASLVRSVRTTP